jgi:hypothetical protein
MTTDTDQQLAELSAIFRNPNLPENLAAIVDPLAEALEDLQRAFSRSFMSETARAEALRGLVALTQAKDHFVRAAVLSRPATPRQPTHPRTPESK